jgi:molybdenum cofactor biosynthesis protein B
MSHTAHTHQARHTTVPIQLVTVTTSRHAGTDKTGPAMRALITASGHPCSAPQLVPDDAKLIGKLLDQSIADPNIRCVILCGGTGPSKSDVTVDVVRDRLTVELPGFGELFRMLSYQEIGAPAMLSRATGGLSQDTLVFALPGSPKAGQLALEKLILPNLRHLLHQMDKKDTPPPT